MYKRQLYEVEFVNPQKRVVKIYSEAKGVLFKENYFKQWRAEVSGAGGRVKLPIYLAGPGLMYVPLPDDTVFPVTVTFTYRRLPQEVAGDLVSILTLIFLTASTVCSRLKVSRIRLFRRSLRKPQ